MLSELDEAHGDEQAIEVLRRSRPLLAFVLDRVLPVLMGPGWPLSPATWTARKSSPPARITGGNFGLIAA